MSQCARCDRPGTTYRRRLCKPCWRVVLAAGVLDEVYPLRALWPADLLLGEWEFLAAEGYTRAQAAERLGVRKNSLDQAILRARKRSAHLSLSTPEARNG